ncbi:hypothetical protein GJ496_004440 [Pomphorhynchus laevis]|nr:hypothetical protein GJ496_005385 [Pomphorhynchus laevis]KAI0981297.1 hypothetical protein GJ496_004440 [Pomphorhynchus laevis]
MKLSICMWSVLIYVLCTSLLIKGFPSKSSESSEEIDSDEKHKSTLREADNNESIEQASIETIDKEFAEIPEDVIISLLKLIDGNDTNEWVDKVKFKQGTNQKEHGTIDKRQEVDNNKTDHSFLDSKVIKAIAYLIQVSNMLEDNHTTEEVTNAKGINGKTTEEVDANFSDIFVNNFGNDSINDHVNKLEIILSRLESDKGKQEDVIANITEKDTAEIIKLVTQVSLILNSLNDALVRPFQQLMTDLDAFQNISTNASEQSTFMTDKLSTVGFISTIANEQTTFMTDKLSTVGSLHSMKKDISEGTSFLKDESSTNEPLATTTEESSAKLESSNPSKKVTSEERFSSTNIPVKIPPFSTAKLSSTKEDLNNKEATNHSQTTLTVTDNPLDANTI